MTKRMLVDATHPEETRVAVVSGNRLEEFDFEAASKQQLKGNIYLAKVTRVEPSLQAAFVEYGGNRHGFLAFSEVHADYYRIPVADREALMAEEARRPPREDDEFGGPEEDPGEDEAPGGREAGEEPDEEDRRSRADREELEEAGGAAAASERCEPAADAEVEGTFPALSLDTLIRPGAEEAPVLPGGRDDAGAAVAEPGDVWPPHALALEAWRPETIAEPPASWEDVGPMPESGSGASSTMADRSGDGRKPEPECGSAAAAVETADQVDIAARRIDYVEAVGGGMPTEGGAPDDEADRAVALESGRVETVGGNDGVEEAQPAAPRRPLRSYRIQEVIKRRQIMLVQVTKEERGNKGAALTTYLSLAGRYCVLMPNTPRGGGVSRKITSPKDRKRMKSILEDLAVPEGMAVILRTAGLERTKAEIKRDFDYLLRLWDSIREITLESTAPCLIHEEANLIKRAIRDLYSKDIDEVLVAGEDGYRTAKDFMRMLMPSHAKKVQHYRESVPLFHRYQVESQIEAMHSPELQLRSGGYIVINPTEALVAIDVNSGRATRERNIEETAYKTNMEAAEEIARQLRLRDLAGLIVIDFIDMEDERHIVAVERKLKESMRTDRARIQLGRISPFGLLELSRQRLRPSFFETHFETCPHCRGRGLVRSIGSAALHVLRAIEDEGIRKRSSEITVTVPTDLALYILNQKRDTLAEIEARYNFRVLLDRDDSLVTPDLRLERGRSRAEAEGAEPSIDTARLMAETDAALAAEAAEAEPEADSDAEGAEAEGAEAEGAEAEGAEERTDAGKRRKRPRRRRKTDEAREAAPEQDETETEEAASDTGEEAETAPSAEDKPNKKKRRRGKRGGRRRVGGPAEGELPSGEQPAFPAAAAGEEWPAPFAAPADRSRGPADWPQEQPAPMPLPLSFGDEEVAAEVFPPPVEVAMPPSAGEQTFEPPAPSPPETELPVEPAAAGPAPAPPLMEEPETAAPEPGPVAEPIAAAEPVHETPAEPASEAEHGTLEQIAPAPAPQPEPDSAETTAPVPEASPAPPQEEVPPALPQAEVPGAAAAGDEPAQAEERMPAMAEGSDQPQRPSEGETSPATAAYEVVNQPPEKPRRGWWQRLVQG